MTDEEKLAQNESFRKKLAQLVEISPALAQACISSITCMGADTAWELIYQDCRTFKSFDGGVILATLAKKGSRVLPSTFPNSTALKNMLPEITQWHAETFPDATLDGQINKFEDELQEFYQASRAKPGSNAALEELADCAIVAFGVRRFLWDNEDNIIGRNYGAADCFAIVIGLCYRWGWTWAKLYKAIEKKMEINRARTWTSQDGSYQHVETNNENETKTNI